MSLALMPRLAALAPGRWVQNGLWRRAKAAPSLDLRFAENKSLVDATTGQNLVTFTRASSGTFVDSDGLIKTATTDAPRFDHNPTTGESLGLLVEESRTNLLVQSEDFSTTWTTTRASVSTNEIAAPNGTTTADKLVEDNTATNTHFVQQAPNFVSGTTHTYSVYAKAAERTQIRIQGANQTTWPGDARFDLSNGTIAATIAGTASIQAVGNGWYRCSITATAGQSAATNIVHYLVSATAISYTGDGTSGIYLWGAQLEAGAFPTSYIPTTTATVTRSADVASISGSNFSAWYRQDEGTLFAEATSNHLHGGINQFPRIVSLSDGTTATRIDLFYRVLLNYTDAGYSVIDSNVSQASSNTNRQSNGTRLSVGYQIDNFAFAQAGSILGGATDNSGTVPVVNQLSIGRRSGADFLLTGTIKRLTYWPTRLPDSTLQAITQQ